jgi:hypothetical protein
LTLPDDSIWAERKLLELELARSIWTADGTTILGACLDESGGRLQRDWIRERLRRLQGEQQRRTRRT